MSQMIRKHGNLIKCLLEALIQSSNMHFFLYKTLSNLTVKFFFGISYPTPSKLSGNLPRSERPCLQTTAPRIFQVSTSVFRSRYKQEMSSKITSHNSPVANVKNQKELLRFRRPTKILKSKLIKLGKRNCPKFRTKEKSGGRGTKKYK